MKSGTIRGRAGNMAPNHRSRAEFSNQGSGEPTAVAVFGVGLIWKSDTVSFKHGGSS